MKERSKRSGQRSASARKPSTRASSGQPPSGNGDTRDSAPGAQVQGEGNYEAARRFNDAERAFVKHADVDQAARAAEPADAKEARDMEHAETETREHAKDEDPQLRHPKARTPRKDGGSGSRDRQDETAAPASPDGEEVERYAG